MLLYFSIQFRIRNEKRFNAIELLVERSGFIKQLLKNEH